MRAVLAGALLLCLAPAARADKPGEEVRKLIHKLSRDKDAEVRSNAADRLGMLKAVEAVPALAAALRDKDSGVRAEAAGALLRIGEPGKEAMPALREALFDSNAITVWNAAGALKNMGVVTTDLMPTYRRLLEDHDCDIRVSAAVAISEYAAPTELLPVALACRLERSRDGDLEKGVRELMSVVGKDRAAIPLIAGALDESAWEVREWAAKALGDMGGAARAHLPALRKMAEDEDERVRAAAEKAVARISR